MLILNLDPYKHQNKHDPRGSKPSNKPPGGREGQPHEASSAFGVQRAGCAKGYNEERAVGAELGLGFRKKPKG